MYDKNKLIDDLIAFCDANELSINEVSRRSGLPVATVSRVLNKKFDPKLSTLQKIGAGIGLDLDWVVSK